MTSKLVALNWDETSGVDHPANSTQFTDIDGNPTEGFILFRNGKPAGTIPRLVAPVPAAGGNDLTKGTPMSTTALVDPAATDTTEVDLTKALTEVSPAVQEAIQKALADASQRATNAETAAGEALAKAAAIQDAQLTEVHVAKAAEIGSNIGGLDPVTFGPVLKAVALISPELHAELERVVRAANEQLKDNVLLRAVGTEGTPVEPAGTEALLVKAEKIGREANPGVSLTKEQAVTKGMEADKALRAEYEQVYVNQFKENN